MGVHVSWGHPCSLVRCNLSASPILPQKWWAPSWRWKKPKGQVSSLKYIPAPACINPLVVSTTTKGLWKTWCMTRWLFLSLTSWKFLWWTNPKIFLHQSPIATLSRPLNKTCFINFSSKTNYFPYVIVSHLKALESFYYWFFSSIFITCVQHKALG